MTSMRDRMLAGELYQASDPQLGKDDARAQELTHRINTHDPSDHDGLRALFRDLLGAIGEDTTIRPPFRCDYG